MIAFARKHAPGRSRIRRFHRPSYVGKRWILRAASSALVSATSASSSRPVRTIAFANGRRRSGRLLWRRSSTPTAPAPSCASPRLQSRRRRGAHDCFGRDSDLPLRASGDHADAGGCFRRAIAPLRKHSRGAYGGDARRIADVAQVALE